MKTKPLLMLSFNYNGIHSVHKEKLGSQQPGNQWRNLTIFPPILTHDRQIQNTTEILLSINGIGSDSMDAITSVYDDFPLMIYITSGVVFAFVTVAFRSILIPLRYLFELVDYRSLQLQCYTNHWTHNRLGLWICRFDI